MSQSRTAPPAAADKRSNLTLGPNRQFAVSEVTFFLPGAPHA